MGAPAQEVFSPCTRSSQSSPPAYSRRSVSRLPRSRRARGADRRTVGPVHRAVDSVHHSRRRGPPHSAVVHNPGAVGPTRGGGNQEAARQALAARKAVARGTDQAAGAQQLQGEQRTAVANFISDFNAFATAQNDWRSKYDVVDESLNRLLGRRSRPHRRLARPRQLSPSAASSTASPSAGQRAQSANGAAAGSGALDPTIVGQAAGSADASE